MLFIYKLLNISNILYRKTNNWLKKKKIDLNGKIRYK